MLPSCGASIVSTDVSFIFRVVTIRARSIPVYEIEEAAQVLINFFRCILARVWTVRKAADIYRRVYDDDYDTYFYVHCLSGESSWEKPKVFLTSEPPLMLIKDQHKRSPRVNREKIVAA